MNAVMDAFNRIRRPSFSLFGTNKTNEPLIVVEESGAQEEDEKEQSLQVTPPQKASLEIDSPMNPYLLSPWRETRKHSLPSQQVTEGITASQVRRLSERGGEGSGPSPNEAAFLATLSQAPAPSGRRHSVVTISKVPMTLFGRNRRESVAALPSTGSRGVLNSRRESGASVGPPSTDPLGSIHNLQLDIMDDIVQSRKARMKLWTTSSEKVCEVQVVDETGAGTNPTQMYTNRRFSDFIQLPPIPSNRRASENPAISPSCYPATSLASSTTQKKKKSSGLLGSRSDISSIFSNLTSSAIEIHKCADETPSTGSTGTKSKLPTTSSSSALLDPNVGGRSTRSNSFDVSILNNAKQFISDTGDKSAAELSGWFTKRHQPMAKKKSTRSKSTAMALSKDMLERLQSKGSGQSDFKDNKMKSMKTKNKNDNKSSGHHHHMDAHVIGSAIEGFLRKSTSSSSTSSSNKGAIPKAGSSSNKRNSDNKSNPVRSSLNWFTKTDEDDSKDTCDSSLCSTLKDLFVK